MKYPRTIVFIVSLVLLLIVQFVFYKGAFTSFDDPYYHAAHSATYITGEKMSMPTVSTLANSKNDLYRGYHVLLGMFFFGYDGTNQELILARSKIFHSLLGASLLAVFCHVLIGFLRRSSKKLGESEISNYALLGTLFLVALSFVFDFRVFVMRPHTFSTIAVLLSLHFILERKFKHLFATAFLYPWFYSFAPFLFVAPVIYGICYLFSKHEFDVRAAAMPFVITAGGFLAGVLTLPQSSVYIYNANILHFQVVYNLFFRKMIEEPNELKAYSLILKFDYLWITAFIVLCAFWIFQLTKKIRQKTIRVESPDRLFLPLMTLSFMAPTLFILRSAEYSFIFLALACVVVFVENTPSWVKKNSRAISFAFILLCCFQIYNYGATYKQVGANAIPLDRYKEVSQFLKANSQDEDVVFIQNYAKYPPLVFYNLKNRYTAGFDTMFMYGLDPGFYWYTYNLLNMNKVCPEQTCQTSDDPYLVLKKVFLARYVFIDEKIDSSYSAFNEMLAKDTRYKLVYTDTKDPKIKVFELVK